MNPMTMMKIVAAKNQFTANHPKFAAFIKHVFEKNIEEGTVIEITVQRPGEQPVTSNIKVKESDLELLQSLKELV